MKDIFFKTLMLKGESGSSIVSFEKTATSGVVDTYTVTFSDGTEASFEVTNGSSIASIEKTATTGAIDTYTVTLTNGDTTTFEVVNGESYEVPTNGVILIDSPTAPTGYEIINNPLSGATTSLKFAKKVSDTNIKGYGNIIDSFNTGDNKSTNAPSLGAVMRRTDNNLLANSSFESYNNLDESVFDETISGYFAGWRIYEGSARKPFGSPYFYLSSGGMAIPSTLPNACSLVTPWYSDGAFDTDIDYITVSLEYRETNSGSWIKESKTFNASSQSPSSQYMFTANGCAVSVSPFESGSLKIDFSATPTATFYIRRVKLERGTSATNFVDTSRDPLLVTAAATLALETLDESEFTPRYKQAITFDYFGGGYFRKNEEPDAGINDYYEILFNLPLERIFDSTPNVTINDLDINGEKSVLNPIVNYVSKAEYKENGGARPYIRLTFSQTHANTGFHTVVDDGYVSSIFANITLS